MKRVKHAKKRTPEVVHGPVYVRLMAALVTLGAVTIFGCLGLLWMRQHIEKTAESNRRLEVEIVKEERRIRHLDSRIAEIHQPLQLQHQIERLGLALRPPTAGQIVYLAGPPLRGPSQQQDTSPSRTLPREPLLRSLDLAVMESFRPKE